MNSLSLMPGQGRGGHCPNPFHVAPEASRIGCEGVSWAGVPPGVIVGRTLEHQMLDRLVGAVAVRADGRVPARSVEGKLLPVGNDQCVLVPPSRTGPWAGHIVILHRNLTYLLLYSYNFSS